MLKVNVHWKGKERLGVGVISARKGGSYYMQTGVNNSFSKTKVQKRVAIITQWASLALDMPSDTDWYTNL